MEQKYIVDDVVMYDNKIMVVKEPRDGSHFDLFHPKEGLVYCFVGVEDIKPVVLTPEILEKNGWKKDDRGYDFRDIIFLNKDDFGGWVVGIGEDYILTIASIHQLQHLLFGLGINHEMEV